MTHRTHEINARKIEVFDTSIAGASWAERHKGDMTVLVRNTSLFMRMGEMEMHVRLNATICDENRTMIDAANAIADEVERLIEHEKAAAA